MATHIDLSGTSSSAPCAVCKEWIPEGVAGLVVYLNYEQANEGSALICFRCVDVMADIVESERKSRRPPVQSDPPEVR